MKSNPDSSVTDELMDKFANAWNAQDVEAILGCMTDDCVYDSGTGPEVWGRRYTGYKEIGQAVADFFKAYPDARFEDSTHFICGDRGVSEWTLTATKPDGSRVRSNGCDLFTFREGKIAVKNSYRKQFA
jgi:ketosteroid isomerase-like protein